jgi:hypothetical protein
LAPLNGADRQLFAAPSIGSAGSRALPQSMILFQGSGEFFLRLTLILKIQKAVFFPERRLDSDCGS